MSELAAGVKAKNYSLCSGCNKDKCNWKDWPWFSPQATMFCRSELVWYLEHKKDCFDKGLWPDCPWIPQNELPTPKETKIFGSVKIPTNVFLEFVATIENRLKKCGEDGQTLVEEVQAWVDHFSTIMPISCLSTAGRDALNYCCGHERKQTLAEWKANRKRKEKERAKKT